MTNLTYSPVQSIEYPSLSILEREVPPYTGPKIEYKQRIEPDHSSIRSYSFEWEAPTDNSYASRERTLLWAQEILERETQEWSDFLLIHGRNKSYLNMKLGVGTCPIPVSTEEVIVCIGSNKFRYRRNCTIEILKRPCQGKRFKQALLNAEERNETYKIEFVGSIQNLVFQYREEIDRFFNG